MTATSLSCKVLGVPELIYLEFEESEPMARNKTFAFGISTALLLALLSGTAFAQEAAAPKATQTLPSIVVTQVENKPVIDRVVATGAIKAVEETYVSPLVDGLSIRTLNADVGDRVAADSTLAVLNDDMLLLQKSQYAASLAKANASLAQYQAQLAEARANAEEAVRVSERSRKLSEAGSISTAQRDQDKAAATAALARVNSAEQFIAVAKADINEADLIKLAIGQKAVVTLADGKARVDGRIRLISPMVDAQTRLGAVYISLNEPEKARVGMYADAQIIIEEKQAIVLPLTAVTVGNSETIVRKVEDGVVHLTKVTTGIQDGEFIEITTGLKPGDKVVAKAGAYVRDGDKINPVTSAATATN